MKTINRVEIVFKIITLLALAALFTVITSCDPCRNIAKYNCIPADTIYSMTTEKIHDSVFYTQMDSAFYDIYFECDSNNQVLISQLNEKVTPGIETKVIYRDNKISLRLYTDSMQLLNRTIEKLSEAKKTVKNPVNLKCQDDLKKAQKKIERKKWLTWYFFITLGIVIFVIVIKLKR